MFSLLVTALTKVK